MNEKKGVKCSNRGMSKRNLTIYQLRCTSTYVLYLGVQGHPVEVTDRSILEVAYGMLHIQQASVQTKKSFLFLLNAFLCWFVFYLFLSYSVYG